jgi:hypothetical protein
VTLILTCLTDDCVYQVSDRRLTSFEPPRSPIDDESNKAVFVSGRVIFGYTGISKVNGENTDLWFTRVAASVATTDMGAISRKICDEATSAFRKMNFASRYKRHAFQGAGWFTDRERSGLRPGTITIHNALAPDTQAWLPYSKPRFELITNFPRIGRAQFHLTSVGLTPTPDEKGAIYQLVRKCVHRRLRRQESILHALVLSMRWLHHRYQPNSPIGPNMMAVALPKSAAERVAQTGHFMAIASGPAAGVATFLDVNIGGRAHVFGPHVVHGGSAMTGFTAGPILASGASAA